MVARTLKTPSQKRRLNALLSSGEEEEGIGLDPDAALTIARLAEGGMRDAISLFELAASKGGRVTAAGALIANVMNLKPVLQIQGAKLDAYAKTRGTKTARKTMIDAMKKDFATRFKDEAAAGNMTLHASFSDMKLFEIETWINEIKEAFPDYDIHYSPLSLSIGCHIGPGSLAIACAKITR